MSDAKPLVFILDDDASVRESLGLLIESAGWQPETFSSGQEFLSRPRVAGPSCLVLDVVLPDLNGCEIQTLLAERADMPIIFISGYADVATTVRAMKAGAAEFFIKPFSDDAIVGAIGNAIRRSCAALADEAEMERLREGYASLSQREREVMALIVSGRLNKQVGFDLGISETTVKAHRGKVMRKMKAGSLANLVRMASRLCLAPLCSVDRSADDGRRSFATGGPAAKATASSHTAHERTWTEPLPAVRGVAP
jgi:FixJ family two-component response regulator